MLIKCNLYCKHTIFSDRLERNKETVGEKIDMK